MAWCYVHFLRNALDYLPRKADNDCLTELRWIAESALIRHQLLILNREHFCAQPARLGSAFAAGLFTLFMGPARILRSAIVLKPSTLLHLHSLLRKRNYRLLFSPQRGHHPARRDRAKNSSTPSWP